MFALNVVRFIVELGLVYIFFLFLFVLGTPLSARPWCLGPACCAIHRQTRWPCYKTANTKHAFSLNLSRVCTPTRYAQGSACLHASSFFLFSTCWLYCVEHLQGTPRGGSTLVFFFFFFTCLFVFNLLCLVLHLDF